MELIYRVKKPETIKRFIKENYIPTSILERDDKHYKIFVNQQIKSTKDTVRKGDKIHFHIKDEIMDKIIGQAFPLDVVYEDDQLIIVYKPANVRMMITKKHPKNTLANALIHYYQKNNIQSKLHFINRVDPDISGLVVLAKHKFIKFLLSDKVNNEVIFDYQAIVSGQVPVKSFNICLPISKTNNSNLREVSEQGKECETNYRVVKEFKKFSLLNIQVKNKITHQIKVHMAHFDYPIVGDKYYNPEQFSVDRILLDGYKVSFKHPITEEDMIIKHPLPKAFSEFI
ncbi:MAG TPA: RluA family pseudouridine synthase [Candidatus Izemoplasmatales bacterium]|nr:RluA family pseudouridine synthase [Candidatus Izemoplasmatales bacterium]